MWSDIWLKTTQIVTEESRYRQFIESPFPLATWDIFICTIPDGTAPQGRQIDDAETYPYCG